MKIDFNEDMKADELKELYENSLEEKTKVDTTELVMKANGRVYLREQATTESDYIRIVERDEEVFVIKEEDGWAETAEGFIMSSFLD